MMPDNYKQYKSFFKCFILSLLIYSITCESSLIKNITPENYPQFKQSQNSFFVMVCNEKIKCNKHLPEFEKAAKLASDKKYNINFGLLDCTIPTNEEFFQKSDLSIFRSPTINFYSTEDDYSELYEDKIIAQKIINFFIDRNGQLNLFSIDNITQLKEDMEKRNIKKTIVFVHDHNSDKINKYNHKTVAGAARLCGIKRAYSISNNEFRDKHMIKDYDLMFYRLNKNKTFVDEGDRLYMNEHEKASEMIKDENTIHKFLAASLRGAFAEATSKDFSYAIKSTIPAIFIIYKPAVLRKREYLNLLKKIKSVASKYRSKVWFFRCPLTLKVTHYLKMYLNITKKDLESGPVALLTSKISLVNDDPQKFMFPKEKAFTVENIEGFVKDLLSDRTKLAAYRRTYSQKIVVKEKNGDKTDKPNETDKKKLPPMKHLTRDNFRSTILASLASKKIPVIIFSYRYHESHKEFQKKIAAIMLTIGESKLELFHLDPLFNEIDELNYKYIPGIAIIKNEKFEYVITGKKFRPAEFIHQNANSEISELKNLYLKNKEGDSNKSEKSEKTDKSKYNYI